MQPRTRNISGLFLLAAVALLGAEAPIPTLEQPPQEFGGECACRVGQIDTVGAETWAQIEQEALCAKATSRRSIAARPPNVARAVACARVGRGLDSRDGWWDFVEGNAFEIMVGRDLRAYACVTYIYVQTIRYAHTNTIHKCAHFDEGSAFDIRVGRLVRAHACVLHVCIYTLLHMYIQTQHTNMKPFHEGNAFDIMVCGDLQAYACALRV